LALEYAGRAQHFDEQAHLLKKILNQKSESTDWCFVACLQSLENPNANCEPLKKLLAKQQKLPPMAQVLAVRLGVYETATALAILQKISADNAAYAPTLNRIAKLQQHEGLVRETIVTLDALAQTKQMNKPMIVTWLSLCLSHTAGWDKLPNRARYIAEFVPQNLRLLGMIATYHLIHHWINGKYDEAYVLVKKFNGFVELPVIDRNDKTNSIFFRYIYDLAVTWQKNPELYKGNADEVLNVIGESHSLSPANAIFDWKHSKVKAKSRFVMGVKMHHLAQEYPNQFKTCVQAHINAAENSSHLLFTIGEIDCRPDEGIWKVHKEKNMPIEMLVNNTVNGYIDWLMLQLNGKNFKSVTVQGIQAIGYKIEEVKFLEMLGYLNSVLKKRTLACGWNFLDVYAATVDENGISNNLWHLDGVHLTPKFYTQAIKWII